MSGLWIKSRSIAPRLEISERIIPLPPILCANARFACAAGDVGVEELAKHLAPRPGRDIRQPSQKRSRRYAKRDPLDSGACGGAGRGFPFKTSPTRARRHKPPAPSPAPAH